jgi:hypothetical protein
MSTSTPISLSASVQLFLNLPNVGTQVGSSFPTSSYTKKTSAHSNVITPDTFELQLNNILTNVSLSITKVSDTVTAGYYHLGRLTKNKYIIKFYHRTGARRPMIWVMQNNKGIVVFKPEERRLQNQTMLIISFWLSNRIILNNPSHNSHPLPSPLNQVYISQLLKNGHVRRPCVKTIRNTNRKFICRSTLVNPAKLKPDSLKVHLEARDFYNTAVEGYCASHPTIDSGSFLDYMERCFPNFKKLP